MLAKELIHSNNLNYTFVSKNEIRRQNGNGIKKKEFLLRLFSWCRIDSPVLKTTM